MKETLFYVSAILSTNGGGYLKDSKGKSLGYFDTYFAAQQWCEENGYRLQHPLTK